eukprot:jgi/Galph1/2761/GphlegSOOS_G1405.1
MPASTFHYVPQPLFCSLLEAGQAFKGVQNSWKLIKDQDFWTVKVYIQDFEPSRGYLCGCMEALDVPRIDNPVITFWEGQIVDNVNYGFRTGQWEATEDDDFRHWSRFLPFRSLEKLFERDRAKHVALHQLDYVFMRWKEQYFVNVPNDCGLTIAGFYYLCMNRITGKIEGYYFDPDSAPFQKLQLSPLLSGELGFSSSHFAFQ